MDSILYWEYSIGDFFGQYVNHCADTVAGSGAGSVSNNPWILRGTRTGIGMAFSIYFFDYSVPGYAPNDGGINYLQGRLYKQLTAGKAYCVTFYVCATLSYGISHIGAYLDDGTIDTTHDPSNLQPQYTPQIVDTNLISDTAQFTKIQGSFVATGHEKFITLGVFRDTGHFRHQLIRGTPSAHQPAGGYLVEDVSVVEIDAQPNAGRDTVISRGDSVRLGPPVHAAGLPVYWYKLGASRPFDSTGNVMVHPDSTTTYVMELDLCSEPQFDTVTVWVCSLEVEHLHRNPMTATFNPNPASDVLTIQDGKGIEVSISQLDGRVVQRYPALQGFKETIDISQLPAGTYLIHFTDPQTGTFATHKLVKI